MPMYDSTLSSPRYRPRIFRASSSKHANVRRGVRAVLVGSSAASRKAVGRRPKSPRSLSLSPCLNRCRSLEGRRRLLPGVAPWPRLRLRRQPSPP